MMKPLILLILLVLSFQTFSQITINKDSTLVTMPRSTYRLMKQKWFECDTAIYNRDQLITGQNSIIENQSIQIESYKKTIIQKDTTIHQISQQLLTINQTKVKPLNSHFTWIAGITGLILGILLVK